jgi:hypothetical protein
LGRTMWAMDKGKTPALKRSFSRGDFFGCFFPALVMAGGL